VALTAAGLVMVRPSVRDRFLSSTSAQGSGDRSFLLRSGVAAFRSAPLCGIGPGRFHIREWAPPGTPEYVRENKGKAHNQFLTIAAESGAIGLLLFVATLVSLGLRIARESSAPFGLGALLHFVLLSLAHDPLFQAPYSMALALGLSFAAQAEAPAEESPEQAREAQMSPAGAAGG
jgi:O-antigen ligase